MDVSWTTRKPERWRIDAFELWCWRTLLRSPLDCKGIKAVHPKGNHSWIFIARIDSEAETHTLVTWCKELPHWKRPWCWERLKAVSLMRQDLIVSKLVLLWLFLIEKGKTDGNSMFQWKIITYLLSIKKKKQPYFKYNNIGRLKTKGWKTCFMKKYNFKMY